MKSTQTAVNVGVPILVKVNIVVMMLASLAMGVAFGFMIFTGAPEASEPVSTMAGITPTVVPLDLAAYRQVFSIPTDERAVEAAGITKVAEKGVSIPFTTPEPIVALNLSGAVQLDTPTSYARVILEDSQGRDHLVYDASFPLDEVTVLTNVCAETCAMDPVQPIALRIEISGTMKADNDGKATEDLEQPTAKLTISDIQYLSAGVKLRSGTTAQAVLDAQNDFKIATLNGTGRLWRAGRTSVSHLTYEEKKKLSEDGKYHNYCGYEYYTGGIFDGCMRGTATASTPTGKTSADTAAPASGGKGGSYAFDWRSRHGQDWMTPVKNQGGCGSCWAFASVGTLEAYVNTLYNQQLNIDLSEQDTTFCSPGGGSCAGGGANLAFDYYKTTGVVDETCWPYNGVQQSCNRGLFCANWQNKAWKISNYKTFLSPRSYEIKKELVENGPLAMSYSPWSHEMVLAGFGDITANTAIRASLNSNYWPSADDPLIGTTYWLVKNSWGDGWGESGYGRIAMQGILNATQFWRIAGAITPPAGSSYSVSCVDNDHDSFCSWGVGSKPATGCPTCGTVPDCNDADNSVHACTTSAMCGVNPYLPSGEVESFGDYTGYGVNGCCGDNAGEYVYSSKCCTSATSTLDTAEVIMPLGVVSPNGADNGQVNAPSDIFFNSTDGYIYVADTYNNRIQVITTSGAFIRSWTQATSATDLLNHPQGITVYNNEVYVSDSDNNRIVVFNNSGVYQRQWNMGSSSIALSSPRGLTVDTTSGEIYVADRGNNRIQISNTSGGSLRKIGGSINNYGSFNAPVDVTISGNDVYVVDYGNNKVGVFTKAGVYTRRWGSYGAGNGFLFNPSGIVVNGSEVLVSDTSNERIQVFTTTGGFVRKWGALGSGIGQFLHPMGITVDASGKIYVSEGKLSGFEIDTHRIQSFEKSSQSVCVRDPSEVIIKSGLSSPPTSQQDPLTVPLNTTAFFLGSATDRGAASGVCNGCSYQWLVDGTGVGSGQNYSTSFMGNSEVGARHKITLRVTDAQSHMNEKSITVIPGVVGIWGTEGTGAGQLNTPKGVAYANNELFISDTMNNRIQVFDATTGAFKRQWGPAISGHGNLLQPMGLAVDNGEVYIADTGSNRIVVFDINGTFHRQLGSIGNGDGFLQAPYDVSVYSGLAYISDVTNNRVQVLNAADGNYVRKWSLSEGYPYGIEVSNSKVYIANEAKNRIDVYNLDGTPLPSFGSAGTGAGQFNRPRGIAINAGAIFVVDINRKVQVFKLDGTYAYGWGIVRDFEVGDPQDIAVGNDRLYVTSDLLQVFNEPAICPNGTAGGQCSGQQYCDKGELVSDCRQCGFTCPPPNVCKSLTGKCVQCTSDANCANANCRINRCTNNICECIQCNSDSDCADSIACNVDHCNFAGTISANCSHTGGTCCANGTLPGQCDSAGGSYCTSNFTLENNRCPICGCKQFYKCNPGSPKGTGSCVPDPTTCCLEDIPTCKLPLCPWRPLNTVD
ncbi:MAG: C1 family peptidase [Patescibacteria group bacterium]